MNERQDRPRPRAAGDVPAGASVAEQERSLTLAQSEVSTILVQPVAPRAFLAFAHGAGAGIKHPFMAEMAQILATHDVATYRYHFPYMESRILTGRRRPPDRVPLLVETVRRAVAEVAGMAGDLPVIAGGKSMGGRMTSTAASADVLPGLQGLVFFGFPLHPPGRPSTDRADHLESVDIPMLFLQGTRDTLARTDLIEPVCEALGALARLHFIEGADHSFKVLKRNPLTNAEVLELLGRKVVTWLDDVAPVG